MELFDNLQQPEFNDPAGLMEIMGQVLHCLGCQDIGMVIIKIAQHLLSLFTDVSLAGGRVGGRTGQAKAADSNQKLVAVICTIPRMHLSLKTL